MKIRDTLYFFLQAATVGIAAAALILLLKPQWLGSGGTVVEVQRAPQHAQTAAAPVGGLVTSYADAVEPASRAVVNVYTAKIITRKRHPLLDDPLFKYFFGDQLGNTPEQSVQTSLGSGVVISADGYILTNNHVIAGADEIQVLLQDGRRSNAAVVGVDKDTDLAVLRIRLDDLPVLPMALDTELRVGDVALAIGNPFGVGQTVTMGIVSATGRNQLGINRYEDFIQTDAAINPGNSGGALINAHGELVGINTAIFSKSGGSQGIGFAIPVKLAHNVMTQIVEQGHVERGWLGVEAQDLTPELAESFGVEVTRGMLISGVLRDGPADRSGIEPGDIILRIDGKEVSNARSAMSLIAQAGPDADMLFDAVRDGRPLRLSVRTSLRPSR